MKLKCKRCGKIWDYNGENKYYASCSQCKSSVNISKRRVVEEEDQNGIN